MAKPIQCSHTLEPHTLQQVEEEAEKDHRSRSNMIEVLIREALDVRRQAEQAAVPTG